MKGVVFTEFFEWVESENDYEWVDRLLLEVPSQSGGAYTAVGNYPHEELVQYVVQYSRASRQPVEDVLKGFGAHMLGVFARFYPQFFDRCADVMEFLESVDDYIHIEVMKLYPDAQLPGFETTRLSESELEMVYRSERGMAPLACGLIEEALRHYDQAGAVESQAFEDRTVFRIRLNS